MRTAARRPEGIVDLRKVKTVLAEGGRAHLTWVIAYNAGIEFGSERYEAIRQYGAALKPPRNTEQSVMFLPIAAPDTSQAPAPRPRARTKPRVKARAKPAAKARSRAAPKRARKPAPRARPKLRAKPQAKRPAKSAPNRRAVKAQGKLARSSRKAKR